MKIPPVWALGLQKSIFVDFVDDFVEYDVSGGRVLKVAVGHEAFEVAAMAVQVAGGDELAVIG